MSRVLPNSGRDWRAEASKRGAGERGSRSLANERRETGASANRAPNEVNHYLAESSVTFDSKITPLTRLRESPMRTLQAIGQCMFAGTARVSRPARSIEPQTHSKRRLP